MLILGIVLFLLGAGLELVIYLRHGWPNAGTWILMGAGSILIAKALGRRSRRAGLLAWLSVALGVLVLFLLWARE